MGEQEDSSLTMNVSLRMSWKSTNHPTHWMKVEPIEIALLSTCTASHRESLAVLKPKDYDVFESVPASSDVSTLSTFIL
jgi:hypothetical protein